MAIWGADVEQLRTLGTKLQAGASEIEQQRSNLTRLLDSTVWEGPDAKHFRSEWSGTHTSALNQVIQALKDAGQKATQERQRAGPGFTLGQPCLTEGPDTPSGPFACQS